MPPAAPRRHRRGRRRPATAEAAALTLLHPRDATPFAPVPSFWSDLHGAQIRSVGLPQQADRHDVVERDDERQRLVLRSTREAALVGALTVNRTSRLAPYRHALHEQLSGPVALPDPPQAPRRVAAS